MTTGLADAEVHKNAGSQPVLRFFNSEQASGQYPRNTHEGGVGQNQSKRVNPKFYYVLLLINTQNLKQTKKGGCAFYACKSEPRNGEAKTRVYKVVSAAKNTRRTHTHMCPSRGEEKTS